MDRLELKAMGKINLGLDVLGRREDGYHEVRMVMQTVYLYDRVILTKIRRPEIRMETNLRYLPTDESNLAYRAVKLLRDKYRIREGVYIELLKRIPVSAGMAGGSADAAAALYGMNQMFRLGLTEKKLKELGAGLGADVPYCIMRGTALAEGIGEKLTLLPACPACQVLLAKPAVSVSTKEVYRKLDALKDYEHPDIDGIMEGLRRRDIRKIAACMGNVLENVTAEECPEIAGIKEEMISQGAMNALMSGSGPTVFGFFEDVKAARRAAGRIWEMQLAKQVYVTSIHHARRKYRWT